MQLRARLVRALAIGLVAGLSAGCFVGDEIDKASALSQGGPGPATKPPAAPADAKPKQIASAAAKPDAGGAPAKSWWETARSLTSEESASDIVGCAVSGRTEFMTRDDCLARGGTPQ